MDLLQRVIESAEEFNMLPSDGVVMAAVSGGMDSMVMLHLLVQLRKRLGFELTACHYNHQLRGAEAHADEAFVRQSCQLLRIPLQIGRGDVRARAEQSGESIEEAARVLRYAFFEESMEQLGANRLATAHHADDNAETVLINLVRGAGLQGLTGIPPRRGAIVRPLLQISHQELFYYAEEHHIAYRLDASNGDRDFMRNRIRHDVMPMLRDMNPQFSKTVARTTRLLRADNDYLNARAYKIFKHARVVDDNYVLATEQLALTPDPVATRVVRMVFDEMGEQAPAARLSDVVALARGSEPSASVRPGGGLIVQRAYGDIIFTVERKPLPPFAPVPLNLDGETPVPDIPWRITCARDVCPLVREPGVCYLKLEVAERPLLVRSRRAGDTITLRRNSGRKTIKKLFIDEKLPRFLREVVPVIDRDGSCVAVGSFGAELVYHAPAGTPCYRLEMTQIKTKQESR